MVGRSRRILALVLLGIAVAVPSVQARERVALVIGNGAYEHAPVLPNPPNDARALTKALEALDFEVVAGFDLDRDGMAATFRRFSEALRGASTGLFFYAGHGLQVGGRNYLVPTDADLESEADLHFEAVPLDLVLGELERVPRTSVVFLDACRDNPLAESLARRLGPSRSTSVGRGLAPVDAGIGTLIAYATQPGNVALDGSGGHSPFAAALLEHMATPGLEVRQMLTRVRQEVISKTDGEQIPWDHSSLTGDFYFKRAAPEPTPAAPAVAPPAPESAAAPRNLDVALELEFWQAIKDSRSPDVYRAYLARFPDGTFTPIARARLAAIEAGAVASAATPAPSGTYATAASSNTAGTVASRAGEPKTAPEVKPMAPQASGPAVPEATQTAMLTPGPAGAEAAGEAPAAGQPEPQAEEARPADADLGRAEKMRIQRSLRVLGLYQGAIDALFGPGTRGAIAAWQRSVGVAQSGVLTDAEMRRLHEAAADRTRELEAERKARADAGADTGAQPAAGRGARPSVATAPATGAPSAADSYEGRWTGADVVTGWSVTLRISGSRVSGDIIYSGLHGTASGMVQGSIDSNGNVVAFMNSNQMMERKLRGRLPRLVLDDGGYRGGATFPMRRQ